MSKKINKKVKEQVEETVQVEVVPPKLTSKEKTNLRITLAKEKVSKEQQKILDELPNTSSRIRYLGTENFTKSEIRDIIGVIYQHVYNVLNTPLKRQPQQEV